MMFVDIDVDAVVVVLLFLLDMLDGEELGGNNIILWVDKW